MNRPRAVVREVSDAYARCLVRRRPRPPLDVGRARAQHRKYVAALERGGFDVTVLPPEEEAPDGCFVEDALIVLDAVAIATRPGAAARRREVESLERAFRAIASDVPRVRVDAPATLDGGDVLRIGRRLLVGRSARTDAAGALALAALAGPYGFEVEAVDVGGPALHLKSAATALDDETVLLDPAGAPRAAFAGLRVIEVAPGEGAGANVVRLADRGHLLAAAAFGRTAERLRTAGYAVDEVDLSEFTAGDAGPTCLSVRFGRRERPGEEERSAGAE